jgi:putative tricarboxylic transport membrane protein
MNRWDFYTGLIFLLLAGAIAAMIMHAPAVQEAAGPGPYFFPALSAILIGGLALTLLLRSFRQPGAAQPAKPVPGKKTRHRIFWIVLWCFIYAASLERLGYILSTALTTFALLAYFTWRAWVFNLVAAIATPVLIYFLFDSLLKIHMPKGPFGF